MADLKKLLAGAGKSWKTAKKRVTDTEKGGFEEFPDGLYDAQLIGAEIGESKGAKARLQVDFSWRFMDGDLEKKVKHDYQGMNTEDGLFYLGRRIEELGYEAPDDLGDLPEVLKAIVKEKIAARIVLKTKGEFQNVYIRKLLGDDADEDVEETEEDETDTETEAEESDDEETEEEDGEEEAEEETEEEDGEAEEEEETEEEETEEEEAEEGEEEVEQAAPGMKVIVETAKGREPGVIVEIIEAEGKVRVKLNKDGKIIRASAEKVEITDDEEEVEEEPKATKKAAGKKPAPAPAPPVTAKKKAAAPAPVVKKGVTKVVKKGKK